MKEIEIEFVDNEPQIKLNVSGVYSEREFKKLYMEILDNVHRERYERDKKHD